MRKMSEQQPFYNNMIYMRFIVKYKWASREYCIRVRMDKSVDFINMLRDKYKFHIVRVVSRGL
jgi:hypothetical protein